MFTTNSSFRGDLEFLLEKLKNRDKFAFSKYADGDDKILVNENIKNCDGWKFEPGVICFYDISEFFVYCGIPFIILIIHWIIYGDKK